MAEPLKVMIVEDDFRVAEITQTYVDKLDGFYTAAQAKTAAEAEQAADEVKPDIILLDMFIPDTRGLQLFYSLQQKLPDAALLVVTAAKEQDIVRRALLGGAIDYMIKPVEFNRLESGLKRAAHWLHVLNASDEMPQQDIDQLLHLADQAGAKDELPKGIDRITLEQIFELLASDRGVTAVEAGEAIGASRSTARRYLEYLVTEGNAEAILKYGDVGRPERRYIRS
ncbi:response regulator [Alkalicoccus luteus]|uniref:Response regulator n=1 Tax=Alkalicoccus luteus TaxID=1237094 RepID=A0A969PUU2_9BACI|nr:response regulator [Alkalicoccus luteus]NJP36092.1 response regulator [Alkalicoccus luteus]